MTTKSLITALLSCSSLVGCAATEPTDTGEVGADGKADGQGGATLLEHSTPVETLPLDLGMAQQHLDTFLGEHAVAATLTYCRTDIATPECRNLITFKNKMTDERSGVFMTTFTAPFRQAGGVEFFFPSAGPDGKNFMRYGDGHVDGMVVVENASPEKVSLTGGKVVVEDMHLGAIVADLSFGWAKSVLDGTKPSAADPTVLEPVHIEYKRFVSLF